MATETPTTGWKVTVSESYAKNLVATQLFADTQVSIFDLVHTTVEEYHSMTEAAALDKVKSVVANNMTDYRIHSSDSAGASWMIAPAANGTIVTAVARKTSAHYYTVTVTTEGHTCSNSANWSTY